MAARKKPKAKSFEERLEALEAVVQDLEGEELALEAAIERYQQGVEHLKACRALLDDAERRLAVLVESAEGDLEEQEAEEDLEAQA